jgi:hypothetical protein
MKQIPKRSPTNETLALRGRAVVLRSFPNFEGNSIFGLYGWLFIMDLSIHSGEWCRAKLTDTELVRALRLNLSVGAGGDPLYLAHADATDNE